MKFCLLSFSLNLYSAADEGGHSNKSDSYLSSDCNNTQSLANSLFDTTQTAENKIARPDKIK